MIKQAIVHTVLEGACRSFVGGAVSIEEFRWQMMQLLQLTPIPLGYQPVDSTTDIKLSHADLPGVITEALREWFTNMLPGAILEDTTFRDIAKNVSKALVLHARRNGG